MLTHDLFAVANLLVRDLMHMFSTAVCNSIAHNKKGNDTKHGYRMHAVVSLTATAVLSVLLTQ